MRDILYDLPEACFTAFVVGMFVVMIMTWAGWFVGVL